VPPSFTPFGTAPTAFPTTPTHLPNSGSIDLVDAGGSSYLTVMAANPLAWPPAFGVLAQGSQLHPEEFNLLVVYNPPSGEGVPLPVLVERFDSVTLDSVSAAFASDSELIRASSFSQQPNPGLSAFALMHYDASEALPAVSLSSFFDNRTTAWTPLPNLLQAGPVDANFVVEVEYDGTARLRNGDIISFGSAKIQFWLAAPRQRGLHWSEVFFWTLLAAVTGFQFFLIFRFLK